MQPRLCCMGLGECCPYCPQYETYNEYTPILQQYSNRYHYPTTTPMSKSFFDQLSTSLMRIPNSPFRPLGTHSPGGLSYAPDRLFNPTLHQNLEQNADKQYQQFIHKQKQKQTAIVMDIQYDLLKRDTRQIYKKQAQKYRHGVPISQGQKYTMFQGIRGSCQCGRCTSYEGYQALGQKYALKLDNYIQHSFYAMSLQPNKIEYLSCLNCQCAMNSHHLIPSTIPSLHTHLVNKSIHDDCIDFGHVVVGYRMPEGLMGQYVEIVGMLNGLKCVVEDARVMSKLEIEIEMVRMRVMEGAGGEGAWVERGLAWLRGLVGLGEWRWGCGEGEGVDRLGVAVEKQLGIQQKQCVGVFLCRYPQPSTRTLHRLLSQPHPSRQAPHRLCFMSHSHKQSLLLAQSLFPHHFQLHLYLHLLPSLSDPSNIRLFEDLLDYNSHIVLMQNFRHIDRSKLQTLLQEVAGFHGSKIGYILGQQQLSEFLERLPLKLVASIGRQQMTIPFLLRTPDYVTIPNDKNQTHRILSFLHPQITYSQRVVLVLKPYLISSGYQQLIPNLLRINKFIIIRRMRVKLSQSQARYIATLQSITEQAMEQYLKYMTTGMCELILVSKRGAIYQAYALGHGCTKGRTGMWGRYRGEARVQVQRGKEVYEEELGRGAGRERRVFEGVRKLVDMETVLFGAQRMPEYSTNMRTGQITRMEPPQPEPQAQPIPTTHNIKLSLLKQLRKCSFNFWLYTSKSQTLTQQLASLFMPECTLFEPITIIVKPGLLHLLPLIRRALIQHKYHIIVEKQVQLSKASATEFVYNCQKIPLSQTTLKLTIDIYSKQKIHILCLSKISGRKQIMSMLAGFTFLASTHGTSKDYIQNSRLAYDAYIENQYIADSVLVDMLVPVWNNQQLFLRMIAPPLSNLEQAVIDICASANGQQSGNINQNQQQQQIKANMNKIQMFMVLNYLVGSFYGVSVADLQMNTKLGRLTYYICSNLLTARLQSWYYAQISRTKPNYVPLLFQYRQIGATVLCIQSTKGDSFVTMVQKMYAQEREKAKKVDVEEFGYRTVGKSKRRSLVLFLWAKKLVELCAELGAVETELKNIGEIVERNGDFKGALTLEQAQIQQKQFLSKLYQDFQEQPQIQANIRRLLDSRHLKQRYRNPNRRLLPSLPLTGDPLASLRVVQKTQVSKLHLINQYQFIDPDNQANSMKDLYTLQLFNTVPQIRTKYSFTAEIYYLLVRVQLEYGGEGNQEISAMMAELVGIFAGLLASNEEVDVIEYEVYLRMLVEFVSLRENQRNVDIFGLLKVYPNLRQGRSIENDDVAGKKRKFMDYRQYYKRNNELNQQTKQTIQKKYKNVDLNALNEPYQQQPVLYDPKDPLHYRLVNTEKRVNLLRETSTQQQRPGIYVEYQRNISEKQQLLREKIKREVDKFNTHNEQQILHETGLEKELWYRRTKGERVPEATKTQSAITKQIEKFMLFKQEEDRKNSHKQIE